MADSTKLGGEAGRPDGCAAIWRDLDRSEKWAGRNLMIFQNLRCKFMKYNILLLGSSGFELSAGLFKNFVWWS